MLWMLRSVWVPGLESQLHMGFKLWESHWESSAVHCMPYLLQKGDERNETRAHNAELKYTAAVSHCTPTQFLFYSHILLSSEISGETHLFLRLSLACVGSRTDHHFTQLIFCLFGCLVVWPRVLLSSSNRSWICYVAQVILEIVILSLQPLYIAITSTGNHHSSANS